MTTPKKNQPKAIEVAKERDAKSRRDEIRTLSTGVKVRITPVSASLISEVTTRYKYPKVPTFFNEDKGRDEENPVHPDYLAAKEDVDNLRVQGAMDAMALFGVELLDGVPEDGVWVKKLKLLGIEFDENDPVERDFYYKKHIALAGPDFALLGRISGLSEEAITAAEDSFQSN
jgi:hypothetical protein